MDVTNHTTFELRAQYVWTEERVVVQQLSEEEHCYAKWKLGAQKKADNLQVWLSCGDSLSLNKWSFDCSCEFYLLSNNKHVIDHYRSTSRHLIHYRNLDIGFEGFIEYQQARAYADEDGTLSFKAIVHVYGSRGVPQRPPISFDTPRSPLTDVRLVVAERTFYVSKSLLSTYSTVFARLFVERPDGEVFHLLKLPDNAVDAVYGLLSILYRDARLTTENVAGVCELAKMYDVQMALRVCEEKLVARLGGSYSQHIDFASMLQLADEFGFDDLMRKCIVKLPSIEALHSLDVSTLKHPTLNAILLKLSRTDK